MTRRAVLRGQSLPVCRKLRLLLAARVLRSGGLLAHHTGTLPGVAAAAGSPAGVAALAGFKQRRGPFLLLADSFSSARQLTVSLPVALRRAIQRHWPGATTFALPASSGAMTRIAPQCFSARSIAVRLDADPDCRYLAHLAGGLLVSSSLNRRGENVRCPGRRLRMRWHRHLAASLDSAPGSGQPSALYRWTGSRLQPLRLPSASDNGA